VALAFDKGQDFALDKPAGVPCPHLSRHRCRIHEQLESKGFPGCLRYECAGAGQRTRALFGGQSWQDDPGLLPRQMDTFRHLRAIHRAIELLVVAQTLALSPENDARRRALLAELSPKEMTVQKARALALEEVPEQAKAFLKSLAPLVAATADENPAHKT